VPNLGSRSAARLYRTLTGAQWHRELDCARSAKRNVRYPVICADVCEVELVIPESHRCRQCWA